MLVGYIVAVFDGVCARIDRRLNATGAGGVSGNLQVLAVGLIDDHRHFRLRDVVLDRNFDDVDIVEDVGTHRLTRSVGAFNSQEFLLHDRLSNRRIETLDITTR